MPQLLSRMDALNWLTPAIADILDQGATPPGGDGSIREQMLTIQKMMGELGTPTRIVNVRPTPSYTLFIARPDTVGRRGSRRTTTPDDIRRSLGHIAEEHPHWKLGYMASLHDTPDTVGIFLRTEDHQPLSLRRLMVRNIYREHPSTMALVIGNTLEQRLIIHDLAEISSILLVGNNNSTQHFTGSLLLTLLLLNTPGEMRIAIAGESSTSLKSLVNTPHALGRLLVQPDQTLRLLEGLVKELKRRQSWLREHGADTIAEYNQRYSDQVGPTLPRIILLLDSLSDSQWMVQVDKWVPLIRSILRDRGRCGIHLILTANELDAPHVPESLNDALPVKVVMRVSGETLNVPDFHRSLTRFVDAFVIERDQITPVEICAISADEIKRTMTYWRHAARQRSTEHDITQISGKTGVTSLLPGAPELRTTQIETVQLTPKELDTSGSSKLAWQEIDLPLDHAEALAAYLGWIGTGPLQDVLGLTLNDAHKTINALKERGLIEDNDSLTPRYIRLSEEP